MAPKPLPREILDRVERVLEYHRSSKHTYRSVRAANAPLDWQNRPSPFRAFDDLPVVALPKPTLEASVPALSVLRDGVAAVAESQARPPQDLKTLSSWLHLANSVTAEARVGLTKYQLRSCPSAGALYPYEVYVAAFGISDLEPGLYHYDVRNFALRKLRGGLVTLAQIKRGRPDLEFLRTVPAALLVSTVFCRTSWRFRQRAYRSILQDAGHLVGNLIAAANGLGVQTTTRLQMNDRNMRDLIGVRANAAFGDAEAVQAMVVWADQAGQPIKGSHLARGMSSRHAMPTIPRAPLSPHTVPYGSMVAAHDDCVAPGVAVREIRAPLTELSPLRAEHPAEELPAPGELPLGPPMRRALLKRRSSTDFPRAPISVQHLWTLNRLAFRGGTFFPIFPEGPHVGLLRPFWIVNDVTGMASGLWYYHPPADSWTLVRGGDFRVDAQYLCLEQPMCGNASAICFMTADLRTLMAGAGPDIYRLAHLESGIVGQRVCLIAHALGLGSSGVGAFYDDEVLKFLDLDASGWEPIYAMAVGAVPDTRADQVQRSAK